MTDVRSRARWVQIPGLLMVVGLLGGCDLEGSYGDPWVNPSQEERLADEGERDPERSDELRERARYTQADR